MSMTTLDAIRTSCVFFDRGDRGKIEADGSEAAVFLHNLSTNDIKGLAPGTGCEAFFCTATAKLLAHGWIWREPPEGKRDRFWLDLAPGLGEKMYGHLDRYLISEDVTLTDQTTLMGQLHLVGPRAAEVLRAAGFHPPQPWSRANFRGAIRCTDPLGMPGYDLLFPAGEAAVVREGLLAAGAIAGDPATWDILRLEAGLPQSGIDMDETTFAPEVNRTAQAISYHKGCYLGQEPIVMARDRGVVQRFLVGLRSSNLPARGNLLFRNGKEIRRVTSSVVSPGLGPIALGYVRRGNEAPGTVVELEQDGVRLPATVQALPFPR